MTTQEQNPAYRPALDFAGVASRSHMMFTVRVVLFGHLKDVFPHGETTLSLPSGATAADAAVALESVDSRLAGLLTKTRVAVREEFASPETVLQPGDEIAFLPPMSGG